ncbi:MAG: hypothetical protein QM757_01795 [Paludibaculum sp.]
MAVRVETLVGRNLRRLALVWLCCLPWSCVRHPGAEGPSVRSVKELRQQDQAALQGQVGVRIQGTVTFVDSAWKILFLQDETGGVRVENAELPQGLRPGQRIEVNGMAGAGSPSPLIIQAAVRVLPGTAVVKPVVLGDERVIRADLEYSLVEMRGVIRSIGLEGTGRIKAVVQSASGPVNVFVVDHAGSDYTGLVDNEVGVRGVLSQSFDAGGEPARAKLRAARLSDIRVLNPPKATASAPVQSIASILAKGLNHLPVHRVRLRGRVEGDLFSDTTGRLRLRAGFAAPSGPTDLAEARGFLDVEEGRLVLTDAQLIPVGDIVSSSSQEGQSRLRRLTTVAEIHRMKSSEAALGYPVRMNAVVTAHEVSRHSLFVQDATGGIYVAGHELDNSNLVTGDLIALEGITGPGEFAPIILAPKIRKLGQSPLPRPHIPDIDELLSGQEDSNWVEARAVVQAIRVSNTDTTLDLNWGSHRFEGAHPRSVEPAA